MKVCQGWGSVLQGLVIEKDTSLVSQHIVGYGHLLFVHALRFDLPDIPIIGVEGNASVAAYAAKVTPRLSRLSGSCNASIPRHGQKGDTHTHDVEVTRVNSW